MFISKAYNYISSAVYKNNYKKLFATMAVMYLIALIGGNTSTTDSTTTTLLSGELFMVIACFAVMYVSPAKKGEPELRSVLPVTSLRRVIYAYVLPLVIAVICLIAWILICVILWSSFCIIVWIISGENPFIFESTDSYSLPILWGELAIFFRFIAAYSFSQFVSHMPEKWWVALVVQAVVLFAWTEIPVLLTESEGVSYSFYNSFGVMPYAWLYVLITGIISLILFTCSVIYVYGVYKPKDY